MKPEKILYAMNDIDAQFLREAQEETASSVVKPYRCRFAVLIAAVIALMALTLTAFAAEEISGWFKQYFTNQSDVPLTSGQIEFIEENERVIAETQVENGWTVELKSAIGSGRITYITLSITAPKDVALNDWEYLSGFRLTDGQGNMPYTWYAVMMDDFDDLDHTCNILMVAEPREANNTGYWNIQIDALYGETYDREYERELLRTKYANQPDFTTYTSEEWAKIQPRTLLTDGSWKFTVAVPNSELTEIELVTEPIKSGVLYEVLDFVEHNRKPVTVTSFLLRPLDASLYYKFSSKDSTLGFPVIFIGTHATVIMNDGTQIALRGSFGSSDGELKLLADSPILLDEVDHVRLSDGTMIPVP